MLKPDDGRARLRWDGTITAGNVIAAVGGILPLLVVMLTWGVRVETRLTVVETAEMRNEQGIREGMAQLRADESANAVRLEHQIADTEVRARQANEATASWLARIDQRLEAVILRTDPRK
jgi:hypothetical protein